VIVIRNLKLRHQLLILIGISIFMMILVQSIYYLSFSNLIQSNAEIYSVNIINQAEAKLELTASSIEKAANEAAYNTTVQSYLGASDYHSITTLDNKMSLQEHVNNLFKTLVNSNPNIIDICLIDANEQIFTAFAEIDYSTYLTIKNEYKLEEQSEPFFTNMVDDNGKVTYLYILPIYSMNPNYSQADSSKLGYCLILCKTNQLSSIVEHTSIASNSLFILLDRYGKVVLSNKDGMIGSSFNEPFIKEINAEKYYKKEIYAGRKSLIQGAVNSNMGWKIVSIIPISELTSQMDGIRRNGIIIAVLTLVLTTLVGSVFIRNITSPIAKIVKLMGEIGEKNIKQRIVMKETNEIGVIATDINLMLDKIENMTGNIFTMHSKLYEMELSKKEAEISALQSQINPHFLYNTLECIRSIGLKHRINDIVLISTSMARIFRYCIKGSNNVTIEEELGCIKDYLSIISIRFMGKIKSRISVDESLIKLPIIKMILQPIVENAVYHGLEAKVGPGTITVNGQKFSEYMEFEIIDDGVGMEEQDVKSINEALQTKQENNGDNGSYSKRSIGLENINNRIRLYYGDKFGLQLYSRLNEGVKVVVTLPVNYDHPFDSHDMVS
jgi:two-component system sensor histidine kinase YesM